ncbi:MAG: RNA polymerase sigma factor, partial [Bacillota bacterium]
MDVVGLVERAQHGDVNAFDGLVDLYSDRALKVAYLITGSQSVAEEAVQETFIICYTKIKQLRSPQTFEAWFYQTLTRQSWRCARKEKSVISLDEMRDQGREAALEDLHVADLLANKELEHLLQLALKRLTLPLRTTVVLRYYNDLSIKEIAQVLDTQEGTVKSRLHSANQQLAAELRRLGWVMAGQENNQSKTA